VSRYDYGNVTNFAWHPTQNIASFTTSDGEVFICPDFVDTENAKLLQEPLQPAPYLHDPLSESSGNARKQLTNGTKPDAEIPRRRQGTPDSLDDILGSELDGDEDDFVVDDDGAGYALNGNGKRTNGHLDENGVVSKRHAGYGIWQPRVHEPIQPGSTPWRGNRRYLALNLIGFVWTVDQETHHTVTVEFYDREFHRDFHFTDLHRYDRACLNENGALFSAPPSDDKPASIYYRPHETWTARTDWRTELPEGEEVTAIALSDSYVVVTTTANYVRIYTLFGTPVRIYRQKSAPAVTCAAWRDYVLTIGNGPVGPSGATRLLYTIENVRRGDTYQNEDIVALQDGTSLASVFFSDNGDPCIYDSQGVLLILQHWRSSGQARWVPLLDTRQLERLASGRKEESYWPVAVAQEKFHCIILKGGDLYPYFPRPLLSEFSFSIPLGNKATAAAAEVDPDDADAPPPNQGAKLEETFVRASVQHSLLVDLVSATHATHSQRAELARREIEVDKALLQLLNDECQAGEEHGMKALEIAGLLRDRTGRMLEAACKIAGRYGRNVLEEKIRELAERRLAGEDDDEELL
jgi:chromosome transmission fidelity protein 4